MGISGVQGWKFPLTPAGAPASQPRAPPIGSTSTPGTAPPGAAGRYATAERPTAGKAGPGPGRRQGPSLEVEFSSANPRVAFFANHPCGMVSVVPSFRYGSGILDRRWVLAIVRALRFSMGKLSGPCLCSREIDKVSSRGFPRLGCTVPVDPTPFDR